MALYFVSYDIKAGHDYSELTEVLEKLGAERILLSVWAFWRENTTAGRLRNVLQKYIRKGDRLIVIEQADWGGWNLMFDPNDL